MNWMDQFECHKNNLRHTLTFLMKPFSLKVRKNENKSQNIFPQCNLVFILEVEVKK